MFNALMFPKTPLSGSRHKYRQMFARAVTLTWRGVDRSVKDFDFAIVEGDKCCDWATAKAANIPYILVEQDIKSLRFGKEDDDQERQMIEGAAAMLLTAEPMEEWLAERYDLPPTLVAHLRPLAEELDFTPMKKLPGKNIVYSGGIVPRESADGPYGYRAYHDIFAMLQKCGWTVHIYPAWGGADRTGDYAAMGCIVHNEVPQGKLYRELSQYQAGFQGYARTGPQEYIKMCRPNKLWEYLGAGIPTFGFNTGSGGEIYDGQWGHIAKRFSKAEFERVSKKVLATEITDEMRFAQTLDNDIDVFCELASIAQSHADKMRDEGIVPSLPVRVHNRTVLRYPVKLAKSVEYEGKTFAKGDYIDRQTAVAMKAAGLLSDPRIV